MLRNDSLADMAERNVVYFELFQWLEVISVFMLANRALTSRTDHLEP